jgi:hypothetical protein
MSKWEFTAKEQGRGQCIKNYRGNNRVKEVTLVKTT